MSREDFWDYFPFLFNTAIMFATLLVFPKLTRSGKILEGKWAWVARMITLVLFGTVVYYGRLLGKIQRDLFSN
jgi:hypothetical protein